MAKERTLTCRTGRQRHHVEVDVLLLEGVVLEEGQLGAARLGQSGDRVVDATQILALPEVRVRRDQPDVELLLVGRRALAQAAAPVGQPEGVAGPADQQDRQEDREGHEEQQWRGQDWRC